MHKRLLDTLVSRLPPKFDSLFQMRGLPDEERGACTTYSRILAEVVSEFGITTQIRPVYVETANRTAIDYLEGKINKDESIRRGGRIQVWGDIKQGQSYQHAVCYIPDWDVIIDLAMNRRASGLVLAYPYWAASEGLPWWIITFKFSFYPLEYRGYETHPEEISCAKEIVRELIRRNSTSPSGDRRTNNVQGGRKTHYCALLPQRAPTAAGPVTRE